MKKRQRKKNEKKYITIIADEFNLLTMSDEEREKAYKDYMKFRQLYAFKKKYRDLKNAKHLIYYFPVGHSIQQKIQIP